MMNKYFLFVRGTNQKFPKFEFENLWNIYKKEKINLKFLCESLCYFTTKKQIKKNEKFLQRLTYIKYIGNVLNESINLDNLLKKIKKISCESFSVRIKKTRKSQKVKFSEIDLAKKIYPKVRKPKVDLKNPQIEFNFVFQNEKIFFLKKIFENKREFNLRMPKKRNFNTPYTLKSDLARVSINFLNVRKGKILDPFCGVGSFLFEAFDMNFKVIGNDIDEKNILRTKKNFKQLFKKNPKKIKLLQKDITNLELKKNSISGIVSDIPYGKSSRIIGNKLEKDFLEKSKYFLKKNKRLVVIFSNLNKNFEKLAKKYFTKIKLIKAPINKSLIRKILVLEK